MDFKVITVLLLASIGVNGCASTGASPTPNLAAESEPSSVVHSHHAKRTLFFSFGGGKAGANPVAPLVELNGLLYGTTRYGGTNCAPYGCGLVFSIDPSSNLETVVHLFHGGRDGANPMAGLVVEDGTLYGTTYAGGGGTSCSGGCGTLFSITASGQENVLHRFYVTNDGKYPQSGLVALNGTLYGTTTAGGGSNAGTIFSVDPSSGQEHVLSSFQGGGLAPEATLFALNGNPVRNDNGWWR